MELIPEWAPNIHPILVHFPIAVILLAVLMDLLSLFLPDKWWDDLKTTIGALTQFPNPGIYKMWVQLQWDNKVITVPFVLNVIE